MLNLKYSSGFNKKRCFLFFYEKKQNIVMSASNVDNNNEVLKEIANNVNNNEVLKETTNNVNNNEVIVKVITKVNGKELPLVFENISVGDSFYIKNDEGFHMFIVTDMLQRYQGPKKFFVNAVDNYGRAKSVMVNTEDSDWIEYFRFDVKGRMFYRKFDENESSVDSSKQFSIIFNKRENPDIFGKFSYFATRYFSTKEEGYRYLRNILEIMTGGSEYEKIEAFLENPIIYLFLYRITRKGHPSMIAKFGEDFRQGNKYPKKTKSQDDFIEIKEITRSFIKSAAKS